MKQFDCEYLEINKTKSIARTVVLKRSASTAGPAYTVSRILRSLSLNVRQNLIIVRELMLILQTL